MELNPKIKIIAVIIIILFIISGIPFKLLKPAKITNETSINNTIIIYKNITIMITPTPDGKLYYANEFQEGIRKIQNPFTFYRSNATGFKNLRISSFVYDYKILDKVHWHNPSDNLDYEMNPTKDFKFLFVFYAVTMETRIADDTRFYLPDSKNFVVQELGKTRLYIPIDYPKQLRLIELENSRDYTNTIQAEYFGQYRKYLSNLEYSNTAGETSISTPWLGGGKSNTISGYIVYEIPNNINEKNLIAGINFYSFGNTWWKLKP